MNDNSENQLCRLKSSLVASIKTAIRRNKPSRPAKLFYELTLKDLPKETTILDYGCGKMDDVEFYYKHGFKPDYKDIDYYLIRRNKYDIITCFYVLNTLDKIERNWTLEDITQYCHKKTQIIFAVRSLSDVSRYSSKWYPYGHFGDYDGFWTNKETYQRGFEHQEFVQFLEQNDYNVTFSLDKGTYIYANCNYDDII